MSEEAQYNNSVPEYLQKSRFPILGRYRDLISFVKEAFSDGKITDTELSQIETVENDILLEFQTAADIFSRMKYGDKNYTATQKLVNQAMQLGYLTIPNKNLANLRYIDDKNVFMSFARTQAKLKNASSPLDPVRDMYREKVAVNNKVIELTATTEGVNVLKDLEKTRDRIEAELPQMRRNLSKLSPDERAELEARVNAMIDRLREIELEMHLDQVSFDKMNEIIGLSLYIKKGKERIRTE